MFNAENLKDIRLSIEKFKVEAEKKPSLEKKDLYAQLFTESLEFYQKNCSNMIGRLPSFDHLLFTIPDDTKVLNLSKTNVNFHSGEYCT